MNLDHALNVVPRVVQMFADYMEDDRKWEKITVNVEEFCAMSDPAFRWHFRLSKPMFEEFLDIVCNHLVDNGRLVRERRPFPHTLLMVLWVLATPECFRAVALRFGVCPSEVHDAYVYVIEAIREIAGGFITWPDHEERIVIKTALQQVSDFPGVVGMMDGCRVPIPAPLNDKASYRDYHHQYSIQMQAVCDHNLMVRDLYVGEAGSLHDSRVFRRSPLCRNLFQRPELLSRGEHIIADSAYTLYDKVLTPFENNGHLTPRQRNYNWKLSQIRSRVERTFGHTQSMWRRMQFLPMCNLDYALDHIVACIVLHNFRIQRGDHLAIGPAMEEELEMEGAQVVGDDVRAPIPRVNDIIHDPYVPHGELARVMAQDNIRGEQKRWDICNGLPL